MLASFERVSNWGRWGANDERGTLNFITPGKVAAAARLVQTGKVVSVSLDLQTEATEWTSAAEPLVQEFGMTPAGTFIFERSTLYQHGWDRTHLDAPAHALHRGKVFGGRTIDQVLAPDGLRFGSIHALRDGIVTRGVLLDVAAARGVHWLEPTDTIGSADLDAAERLSGTKVATGDAVFLRAGTLARALARGPHDPAARLGPGPDCAEWFHAREVALLASDCP